MRHTIIYILTRLHIEAITKDVDGRVTRENW
jgi:hypothetical protein